VARRLAAAAILALAACAAEQPPHATAASSGYTPAPMPTCLRGSRAPTPTVAENTADILLGALGRGPTADNWRLMENEARRKSCGCSIC